jgi:DNA helicase-2/ATP-dependent DNA helicase PcrA
MTVETRAAAHGSEAILEDLNERQREAVTHGEGPLLIVAGAGTGKTQVITRRIAWLIAEKRARPDEILALTFTEKAAAEMESRVDVLVPYGYTDATIATFHAFGDRLVRSFGIELGITTRPRVCTEAEVRVFLREHLFDLGLQRFAPLGQPDRHLSALVKLFSRARDEDVSPEEYLAYAERLAREAQDDASRDEAASELEKAQAYRRYRDLMLAHDRLDFGDQVGLALRILRERPHVLRQLRDQYRFVLVDEFQDTNHAQFEMVRLLAGERRNLTVVGDDDQSIYRFRGAKMANLLAFLDAFAGARTVVLTDNYRSRQNLLDASYRLIQQNNPDRLEARLQERAGDQRFDKRLRATHAGEGVIEHREFHAASDEADFVAGTIRVEIEAGRRKPGDFAILARTHRHLIPVLNAIEVAGIPFQQSAQSRLYSRDEVRLCLAILRAVADPEDSAAVFQLLAAPLFAADDTDLARLSSLAYRRNQSLRQVLERLEAEPLLHELKDTTREAAGRYLDLSRKLAHLATRRPTTDVLYAFVHESGFLAQLTAEDTLAAEERVRNLGKFFNIAKRIGESLDENRVHSFVRYLDLLIEAGDDPAAAEVDVELNAVQVITAHNAKGLEFPVVFMVSLVENRFPIRDRGEELPFPAALVKEPPTRQDPHLEEERRLFYVGMTRAREELFLTWANNYGTKMPWKMSKFVAEALDVRASKGPRQPADARESIERHAPAPVAPAATRPPIAETDLLELSSARIDDYLACPLKYRYAHEVHVPLASDPRFMYGTAIHNAILAYYQHRLRGYPISADDLILVLERSWSSDGFLSRDHEERRLAQGRDTLRQFVEREERTRVLPLQVEQTFKFRQGMNVVSGRWDRIDERDGGIVVVDFKTSDVEEEKPAMQRTMESLDGGQLGLYALAYMETRQVLPARVELHFVDSGAVGRAAVSTAHLDKARERIAEAAAGIRAARFLPKPDYNTCRNCPYGSTICPHSAARASR